MAAVKAKIPVGSAPWLVQERRQADELVEMETEEFGYSVRNEMEWLNEHMGEIFSNNNLNVADIFKTPGKLRGKTPRTARKRNAPGERAPLTDIFAPNTRTTPSPTKTAFYKQVEQLQIQQTGNTDENGQVSVPSPPKQAPIRSKDNWDSGYHGITDDETDAERSQAMKVTLSSPQKATQDPTLDKPVPAMPAEQRRATDETFVSAKEDQGSRNTSSEHLVEDNTPTEPDQHVALIQDNEPVQTVDHSSTIKPVEPSAEDDLEHMDVDGVRSPSDSSSPVKPLLRKSSFTFSSLPSREPLAQKKSIGARSSVLAQARSSTLGRFTSGKSLGGQQNMASTNQLNEDAMDVDVLDVPDALGVPILAREESETTRNHNHSTTQRLQDRINMLGQTREMRTSKPIPNLNASTAQSLYPQLPQNQLDNSEDETLRPAAAPSPITEMGLPSAEENEEEDWIAPVTSTIIQKDLPQPDIFQTLTAESDDKEVDTDWDARPAQAESPRRKLSPSRPKLPFGPKKAASSSHLSSPTKSVMAVEPGHQKAISVSNPTMQTTNHSTTPAGSPRRGHLDGAVSATKAKLYSALRSAKGIFASSASVSAEARIEALSTAPKGRQQAMCDGLFGNHDGAVPYPDLLHCRIPSAESAVSAVTTSSDGRRTRSSTEREQKRKEEERQMRKVDDELQKVREKERQKAATAATKLQKSPSKAPFPGQRPAPPSRSESERSKANTDVESSDEMPPPPPPKSMLPTTQAQRMRVPGRIAKPTKEGLARTKPAPVAVRMPSQRIGHHAGPSTTALAQSLHETLPPAPPPKPTLASKASTTSLHSSTSTNTLRGANSSQTARKALDAAAKKKEADDKIKQRKAEQKRELEQRKAAKQEEERRRQEEERRRQEEDKRRIEEERRVELQRRAAEQQRREEARRAAQRQAAEAKRLEQERLEQQRLEQQRLEQERREQQRREQQRAQQDGFAYALKHERAQTATAPPSRADLGGARPLSRMMNQDGRPAVQMNPAKPPKRVLQEEEELHHRPTVQRNPPSYQQLDAKRRKTNDEEDELNEPRRSVMAGPPVRQSNIRKQENKFPHGYGPAPTPAQHNSSMYIKTVTSQHQLQHGARPNDMAKFANGRIPFADAPNPPGPSSANPYKTPGRQLPTAHGGRSTIKSAAKSSPHYPNPESINLPEIATDSEDEDSENEFQAPDWTDSPALRELLTQQQLVDPQAVFGPIAPLRMEEVFRNKDRQKKFRDRTSSANWNGADRLTEEERQRDREARERLMRDGGWTFQPGH